MVRGNIETYKFKIYRPYNYVYRDQSGPEFQINLKITCTYTSYTRNYYPFGKPDGALKATVQLFEKVSEYWPMF